VGPEGEIRIPMKANSIRQQLDLSTRALQAAGSRTVESRSTRVGRATRSRIR
jgi:hypothetical protein